MAVGKFDFDIHYDGVFYYHPLRYLDGQVLGVFIHKYESFDEFLAFLERDTMSLVVGVYYVVPGNDVSGGLLKVTDDLDLACMYDIAYCYGKIDIYLNHIQNHQQSIERQLALKQPPDNIGEVEDANALNNVSTPGSTPRSTPRCTPRSTPRPQRNDMDNDDRLDEPDVEDPIDVDEENGEEGIAADDSSEEGDSAEGNGEQPDGGEDGEETSGPKKLVRRLFQDKGKKKVEDRVVEDSDSDCDYEEDIDCSSDSDSDAASVDYLSEGEDELREVRLRKIQAKNQPKPVKQPALLPHARNHSVEFDMAAEHDEFIQKLLKKINNDETGELQDPFQVVEHEERWPIHNRDTPWRLKKPVVGEKYVDHYAFRECLTYYGLANGFSIWYEKSTQKKVIARCGQRPPVLKDPAAGKQRKIKMYPAVAKGEESKCPWRCYGKKMTDEASFQVVSMVDDHNCTRNFRFGSLVSYKWIGKQFGNKIRANPSITLVQIADLVMKKYKCIVTHNQCRSAKTYALTQFEKSIEEHYGMLRSYSDELLASNPGSTVSLHGVKNADGRLIFDRMYICLKGLKEGWKHGCRRIIALDGCFLKSPNTGELLTAIGRDGNNHIYPIAWAVVSVENKYNWSWFLELLSGDLDIECGVGITVISDQHKGLIEAVKDMLPYAEHRQCARHIYEGFRKRFSGLHFRSMFWAASKASYPSLFNRVMGDIRLSDRGAFEYLMDRNPKSWSRAFFKLHRGCDSVENGFSECFNSVILTVRNKPIITMFEAIRAIILERQSVMRELCSRWKGNICPSIQNRLEWAKDQQRFWKPFHAGGEHWEVRQLNEAFKVNLAERKCSCRMWELSGVPCPHACSVILKIAGSPEDFVPGWFRKEKYLETYSYHIMPVGGMSTWTENKLDRVFPPEPRRMPGRPKKKRKRAAHEGKTQRSKASTSNVQRISRQGLVMTCSRCGQKGHNKSKCQNTELEHPAKEPNKGGRPRKAPKQGNPEDPGSVSRGQSSRGQASVSIDGRTVAEASVEVGGSSRGHARVSVGGEHGRQASIHLSGGLARGETPMQTQESPTPQPQEEAFSTPIQTQESQTNVASPQMPRPPRWTKCKILQDKSPMRATSSGPSRRYEDNVILGSHSVITRASAALGVTSVGYGNRKTRGPLKLPTWWGAGVCIDPISNETFIGGSDSIPVPIWPKDVPLPSATEEYQKRQKALEQLRKENAEKGKTRAVEAVKRMLERDVNQGVASGTSSDKGKAISEGTGAKLKSAGVASGSATGCVIRKVGGSNKQVKSQPLPPKLRPRSERIMHRKLGKKVVGPGSTYEDAVTVD